MTYTYQGEDISVEMKAVKDSLTNLKKRIKHISGNRPTRPTAAEMVGILGSIIQDFGGDYEVI